MAITLGEEIDWNLVKGNYPRAYEVCTRWLGNKVLREGTIKILSNPIDKRLLYDFFDSKNIIGCPAYEGGKWSYNWDFEGESAICHPKRASSRKVLEVHMFDFLFDILETKLKE